MSSLQEDELLMLSYQRGDSSAFDSLYHRHKDSLMRYLVMRTEGKSVAEELFQEIWLSLINSRERYEAKAKFASYLFSIAHNKLVDYYRHKEKHTNTFQPVENDDDFTDSSMASHESLHQERQITLLKRSIAELPDDQRDTFLLKVEAGLSVQEIADITGSSFESTKSRLRYSFSKLKKGLAVVAVLLLILIFPNWHASYMAEAHKAGGWIE